MRYSGIGKIDLIDKLKKEKIIQPQEHIQDILENTNVIYWRQNDYNEFKKCGKIFEKQFYIKPQKEGDNVKLFESVLVNHYKRTSNDT